MWDLGSLTRDGTHSSCIGRRSLNHWTTKEVPVVALNLFLSRKTEIRSCVQLCGRVKRKEGVTIKASMKEFLHGNGTVLYVDCHGGYTNLYM